MPNESRPFRVVTLEPDFYGEQTPAFYRFRTVEHAERFAVNAVGRVHGIYHDRPDGVVEVLEGSPAAESSEAFDKFGRPLEMWEIIQLTAGAAMSLEEVRRGVGLPTSPSKEANGPVAVAPRAARPKTRRGGRPRAMSDAQIDRANQMIEKRIPLKSIADEFGCHISTIRRLKQRRSESEKASAKPKTSRAASHP